MLSFIFISVTILLTVAGQLLIKTGMTSLGPLPGRGEDIVRYFVLAITNLQVLGGLLLAVLAYISWLGALAVSQLSFAYPFLALGIVLVLALSGVILGENVSAARWIGVIIVCVGLIIASRG